LYIPILRRLKKYTGYLRQPTFEIFRQTLSENGLGDQARISDGFRKLQVLCYKAEIEADLELRVLPASRFFSFTIFPDREPLGCILNPFFESKGYVTPEEFRMFCNETVALARMEKQVFLSNEIFNAGIEIFHFGAKPLSDNMVICKLIKENNDTLIVKVFKGTPINTGNCINIGTFSFDFGLAGITKAQKIRLEVSLIKLLFLTAGISGFILRNWKLKPGMYLLLKLLIRMRQRF